MSEATENCGGHAGNAAAFARDYWTPILVWLGGLIVVDAGVLLLHLPSGHDFNEAFLFALMTSQVGFAGILSAISPKPWLPVRLAISTIIVEIWTYVADGGLVLLVTLCVVLTVTISISLAARFLFGYVLRRYKSRSKPRLEGAGQYTMAELFSAIALVCIAIAIHKRLRLDERVGIEIFVMPLIAIALALFTMMCAWVAFVALNPLPGILVLSAIAITLSIIEDQHSMIDRPFVMLMLALNLSPLLILRGIGYRAAPTTLGVETPRGNDEITNGEQ